MLTNRITQFALTAFIACLSGCSETKELSRSKAKTLLEAKPVQIIPHVRIGLSDAEIACATSKGLFERIEPRVNTLAPSVVQFPYFVRTGGGEKLGLNDAYKDGPLSLPADDKDLIGKWQVEVFNNQKMLVDAIDGISNEPGAQPGNKIVAATVHIQVPHACFAKPYKAFTGYFDGASDRVKARPLVYFRFRRYDDGWRVEWGGQER